MPPDRLVCHAPHPHPTKRGQQCGTPLGTLDGVVHFVTTADAVPQRVPDGQIWIRCSRKTCGRYNRFTRVPNEAAS